MTVLALALIAVTGCNGGEDEAADTESVVMTEEAPTPTGTIRELDPPPSSTIAAESPVEALAAGEPEPPSGGDSSPLTTTTPPAEPNIDLQGRYNLTRVDGQGLPMTIETAPGCRLRILSGDLRISGDRFHFRNSNRQECDGEGPNEMTHTATGTVTRNGRAITLNATSGPAFGTANGTFDERADLIHITSVSGQGGTQPVDWILRRG
ncbi:MAG TPA: hypothetical protein VM534_04785 [Thermoanaerobaculia bacterium]|nr:hypothetical protein [Thermoanaerobaculia bacterium]